MDITGGDLTESFYLENIQFYWDQGNEHTIDGKRFPLEVYKDQFCVHIGTLTK